MTDDFLNQDPFEDIVSSFFGQPVRRRSQRRIPVQEETEGELGFIETDDLLYLIAELPGFSEKDVLISVKGGKVEIRAQKVSVAGIKEYLAPRLESGMTLSRELPDDVEPKKFTHTFKNGVLEVAFKRT